MKWYFQKSASVPSLAGKSPALSQQAQSEWQLAFQHHRAGRLTEAARLYRKILDAHPLHFDSHHLLGVIALQEGRLEEARNQITQAIELDGKQSAAHANLGTTLLRLGNLTQAQASLETALRLDAENANAAATLGTVLLRQGKTAAAAGQFRAVLASGAAPHVYNELGAALLALGDVAGAIQSFEALMRQRPNDAPAHSNLGIALERAGDLERALREYEAALALDGGLESAAVNRATLLATLGRASEARHALEGFVGTHANSAIARAHLGQLLREFGELPQAEASLRAALKLDPTLFIARLNLVRALFEGGDPARARAAAEALVNDHPGSAESHELAGRIALATRELPRAEAALRRAMSLDATLASAPQTLGLVMMAQGNAAEALKLHQQAARLDPGDVQARWACAMATLPPVFDHEQQAAASREAFANALREMDRWFDPVRTAHGFRAVGSTQPFYLAYQPGNHKELLLPYGRLCQRLMAQWPRPEPQRSSSPGSRRPIRIGVVSAHIQDHSVWNAIVRGWIQQLDRSRFELDLFSLGSLADDQTREAQSWSRDMKTGPASLAEWVKRIESSSPDVIVYPEIGMDPLTAKLASLRLARLQVATWGHPLTTGLPTIDAFISAAAMEPPAGQDHYCEELVKLPGLGVCYEPLKTRPEVINLDALGLPAHAPLLLCPGLPFKYFSREDIVWANIARRLPTARLVFFDAGPQHVNTSLRQRLQACFASEGMEFERHVSFIPMLNRAQFFGLMQQACLFLDTIGFSGFNTAMQALQCDLPIVAFEGEALRGRFAAAILRELGLADCVATSTHAYVDLVVGLASNETRRNELRSHIRAHRSKLFGTRQPVRALEEYFERELGDRATCAR